MKTTISTITEINRTPKSNSEFIKGCFEPSTIQKLEQFGYCTIEAIDNCHTIGHWLDLCFYSNHKNRFVQVDFLKWIKINQEINELFQNRKNLIIKLMQRKT
jgi:hypothetical protein